MSQLKFYTDTHIPKQIVIQLQNRGVDVLRCQEVGMDDAEDEAHLDYATGEQRTLITHDEDFFSIDACWRQIGKSHTGIVHIAEYLQGRGSIGYVLNEPVFLYGAVEGGAATLEKDVYNKVNLIT